MNNKSSYWAPAQFNENDEVVLPGAVFIHNKTFAHSEQFDRNPNMRIPNSLEMPASKEVQRSQEGFFKIEEHVKGKVTLVTDFPQRMQLDENGTPVLSSADNIATG